MERREERSLLNEINRELALNLFDWKASPYSDYYAGKIQVLLRLAKKADLTAILNNDDDKIRILPQDLETTPIEHWPEKDCEVFKINCLTEQMKNRSDPYVLDAYADTGRHDSSLTIYHMHHGTTASFLPSDIESIEIC